MSKKKKRPRKRRLVNMYVNLPYNVRRRTDRIVKSTVVGTKKMDSYIERGSKRGKKHLKKKIGDILRRLDKK